MSFPVPSPAKVRLPSSEKPAAYICTLPLVRRTGDSPVIMSMTAKASPSLVASHRRPSGDSAPAMRLPASTSMAGRLVSSISRRSMPATSGGSMTERSSGTGPLIGISPRSASMVASSVRERMRWRSDSR